MISSTSFDRAATRRPRRPDDGGILPLILVFVVFAGLIAVPLLSYATSVLRAGNVEEEKAEGVEFARGGTWVALSNQEDLYDMCVGGTLPSSIEGVVTTCDVLQVEQLRPIEEVPFHVSTVLADTQVPAALGATDVYTNPNTPASPAEWLATPDWTAASAAGKIWLPQLPVRAVSGGDSRDTFMPAGTQDPAYSSCRVLFPGTFDDPVTFTGPTYLTSGVYYFTQPVTLESGADVVVGDGSAVGCTTDFEAIANADDVPDPLNMSGLGGTIILGGDARIVVDDTTGPDDIRFVVNRRYVSELEESVKPSEDVSIISVNGAHAPLLDGEVAGDPLVVADTIAVPASTVGTDGNPSAASSGYEASTVTFRPDPPDAPEITRADVYQETYVNESWPTVDDGRVVVEWTEPANNGAAITDYIVTDQWDNTCSPPAPTAPDFAIQTSCSIVGYGHNVAPDLTVVAVNSAGTSDESDVAYAPTIDLTYSYQTDVFTRPDAPQNLQFTSYSDGLEVSWDAPADDGGIPIASYRVTVTDPLVTGSDAECAAWFDETSCVVPLAFADHTLVDVAVEALHIEGDPATEHPGAAAVVTGHEWVAGATASPPPPDAPEVPVTPVLDFSTTTSAGLDVEVAGYVSVPQGRVVFGAVDPASTTIDLTGGLLAGSITVDEGGAAPAVLGVEFENPDAQKQVRLRSTYTGGDVDVMSEAIVQINKSGSLGINSWIIGSPTSIEKGGSGTGTTVAPTTSTTTTTTSAPATTTTTTVPATTTTTSTTTTTTTTTSTTTTTTLPPNSGPTHPTLTGSSGQPIGNHPEVDYCASGQTSWTHDFGSGTWLAEYWNFTSSMNTGNYGANIFAGAPDSYEYVSQIANDWGTGTSATGASNYFGIRYTATINVPDNCTMEMRINGDDGYALYVDGVREAEDWGLHANTDRYADVTLDPGENLVVVDFYEWGGHARIELRWKIS